MREGSISEERESHIITSDSARSLSKSDVALGGQISFTDALVLLSPPAHRLVRAMRDLGTELLEQRGVPPEMRK